MGHGTLVDGVQRQVTGGFMMVDGVQRRQKLGLTLVDGVQREVGFSKTFTVTLTGNGWNATPCYIMIDGVKYAAAQALEVQEGTEILCSVFNLAAKGADTIKLNGVGVAAVGTTAGTYAYWTYTHTVASNLTITGLEDGMVGRKMEITAQ